MKFVKLMLISIMLLSSLQFVLAQESINTGRRKYYNTEELKRLINKAREAGISEEDLRKLTIRDGDKEINVMEYIEKEKEARIRKDAMLKELLSKKFLTVNDIYNELIKGESEEIKKLREELVSER